MPTWQGPRFATLAPAHAASGHPHQYVTPVVPHTGSGRKQLAGQEARTPSDLVPQGLVKASEMPSDRAAEGRRNRRGIKRRSRAEVAIDQWRWKTNPRP